MTALGTGKERVPKILVTGFNRFGKLEFNPTEQMMVEVRRSCEQLTGCRVVAAVLPTEFDASGRRLRELLGEHEPDSLLGFGVSAKAGAFLLERFAVNIDDAREPDNAGHAPAGRPIVPGGPAAYVSTLPLERIHRALERARVPVAYSNHAGTYVCNHVFYLACHEMRGRPCGFVHVPLEWDVSKDASAPVNVAKGAVVCIEALAALAAHGPGGPRNPGLGPLVRGA
ncbi:MAG: pyroglutamyl-peptidase I [Candidatus Wallbacteria bacterium]|nr:pyroglutamyl-peptidase I [Candidatus Wallbacteria bacterium]